MKLKRVTGKDHAGQLLAVARDGSLHVGHWRDGRFIIVSTGTGGISLREADIEGIYEVTE